MTTAINNLNATTAVTSADQFAVWSASDQSTMRAPGTQVLAWLQSALTFTGLSLSQQYAAPSATGFSVSVTSADSWLILTPVAGYAAGTIVLPATRSNQQIVRVNCTQSVTTLTVSGNGTTVTGAPTTLAANAFFLMQYDATTNAWYRVS